MSIACPSSSEDDKDEEGEDWGGRGFSSREEVSFAFFSLRTSDSLSSSA